MKNNKGFSLIELLIVMALAVILMAMAMSIGSRAVKNAAYSGAVNRLLAEVSFVKQLAARENRYILFEFKNDGRSYSIKRQVDISNPNTLTDTVKNGSFFEDGAAGLDEFYDKNLADGYSFVVNSMGMIFKKSDITGGGANPSPSPIIINVSFKDNGRVTERDRITISPSGGVNVKKVQKI